MLALSISPYITASIVIQLLTVAIPALERMAKNGEDGQKKLKKITRYTTVALAVDVYKRQAHRYAMMREVAAIRQVIFAEYVRF